MNSAILSSSSNDIDCKYLEIARSISSYLASNGFNLVYGGCSSSMMGICYSEFSKQNRTIYSFTTEKYTDDIPNLPLAKHYIRETTFDLKKSILAFVEENRSNDKDVPIIIYDEDNYYDYLYKQLKEIKDKKFTSNIDDLVIVIKSIEEFKEKIEKFLCKEGK
jgi:predicted Rossmann-fold nucleotide-binding protein